MLPTIGAFIESSLIEWPGKIATAIALQGCNFRCPYCHSAPLVPAKGDEMVRFEAVAAHFERRRGWLDGTVVSGGEPLMHPGLGELLAETRALGLAVKLDTNGSFPERLADLMESGLVDYVAMDVKAPLDAGKYALAAGVKVDPAAIGRSIEAVLAWPGGREFRTTLCPAVLCEDDVLRIAEEVASAPTWFLQQFRPMGCLDPAMLEVEPWSAERIRRLAERCAEICPGVMVRGEDFASEGGAEASG